MMGLRGVGVRISTVAPAARALGVELALAAALPAARAAEFITGRVLARELIAELGMEVPYGIGREPCGAPSWPNGVTGSIAHSGGYVAVAAATESGTNVGIDIERIDAVSAEVACAVAAPGELGEAYARTHETSWGAIPTTTLHAMLFTAKESAYKTLSEPWQPRSLRITITELHKHGGTFSIDHALPITGEWIFHADTVCAVTQTGAQHA